MLDMNEVMRNFDSLTPKNKEILLVFSRGILAGQKNSDQVIRKQSGLGKKPPCPAA
jgi:hypothetical protein